MTAGGVPAIDFNEPNSRMDNQPASFISAMKAVPVEAGMPGDPTPHGRCPAADAAPADVARPCNIVGAGSEGACSVSTQCYLPNRLVEEWIMPRLSKANLRVFLRVFQVAPIFSVEACFEENDPKDGPITAFRNKDDFPSQQARESPCFTLTTCDNFLLTRYVRRYETTRPEMRLSIVQEARQRVAPSLPRYVCCNESWLCAM